jgi:AcrR family transcriptional regulator
MKNADAETLDRILIAAEWLFAEQGYDGTTLRQITQKAKVNLAAVNYHHGDKESLYLDILRRRLQPINQVRLARLDEAEQRAGGEPVPLVTLMEILAGPLFELFAGDENSRQGARLVGRALVEPLPFTEAFLTGEFQPWLARFGQALRRHVPALAPEDFLWRFSFVIGALQHSLATLHRMKSLTRGICRDNDHAAALARFVQFGTVAFRPQSGDCHKL